MKHKKYYLDFTKHDKFTFLDCRNTWKRFKPLGLWTPIMVMAKS